MIKVLFFAHLRDLAQTNELIIERGEMEQVRDLLSVFSDKCPSALLDALQDQTAMVSINQQYAAWDAELPETAEIGFLPPVSGG